MSNIPAFMADDTQVDFSSMPSDEALAEAQNLASALVDLDRKIIEMEDEVARLKKDRATLANETLPSLFDAINLDKVGLPEAKADVVIVPDIRASISASWEPERRGRAFQTLEEFGAGDLIKATITVEFGKGELEEAEEIMNLLNQLPGANSHPAQFGMNVHHGTLTSWLKEQLKSGDPVPPLEDIGAYVGRTAKIKLRKDK